MNSYFNVITDTMNSLLLLIAFYGLKKREDFSSDEEFEKIKNKIYRYLRFLKYDLYWPDDNTLLPIIYSPSSERARDCTDIMMKEKNNELVKLINDLAEAYCTYGFFIGNGAFADERWEQDKQEEKEYIREQLNNLKLNVGIIDRGPFLYNGKEYYIPGFDEK